MLFHSFVFCNFFTVTVKWIRIPISAPNFCLYLRLCCVLPVRSFSFCFIHCKVEKLSWKFILNLFCNLDTKTHFGEVIMRHVGWRVHCQTEWDNGHNFVMASTHDDASSPPFTDLLHIVIKRHETISIWRWQLYRSWGIFGWISTQMLNNLISKAIVIKFKS